ncbi:hypothetical protein SCUP234_06543 [Seiridium cupressi]
MRHFVRVGNCCLDTILTVPHFVVEDDKLSASNVTRRRGGSSPNTTDVLEQLVSSDDKTKANIGLNLVAVLPDSSSPAVQEIRRSLGPGVSTANCIYRHECDEPASSYIIKNLATDSRTIISYNTLPDMKFEEFTQITKSFGREATWYHFEGRIPAVTMDCIRHVRRSAPDVRVSVEIEKFPRQGLQELVPEADVVFYSKTWAINELKCSYEMLLNEQGNGYKSPEACLREQAKLTPNALINVYQPLPLLYLGGTRCLGFRAYNRGLCPQDAWVLKDSSVIDTIGAGDIFIAGMLYSYLAHQQDWPLPQKLEFASELAGRKVIQEGVSGLGRLMRSEFWAMAKLHRVCKVLHQVAVLYIETEDRQDEDPDMSMVESDFDLYLSQLGFIARQHYPGDGTALGSEFGRGMSLHLQSSHMISAFRETIKCRQTWSVKRLKSKAPDRVKELQKAGDKAM